MAYQENGRSPSPRGKAFYLDQVMDYVHIKASKHILEKKLKGWVRKVEITAMQTKRMRQMWRRMVNEVDAQKKDRSQRQSRSTKLPELSLNMKQ